jgi:hypothetical protein
MGGGIMFKCTLRKSSLHDGLVEESLQTGRHVPPPRPNTYDLIYGVNGPVKTDKMWKSMNNSRTSTKYHDKLQQTKRNVSLACIIAKKQLFDFILVYTLWGTLFRARCVSREGTWSMCEAKSRNQVSQRK